MEIKVVREQYRAACTIGRMFVNGAFECFTLEDGVRTNKVFGETAIPAGSYSVIVNFSPRFKTTLPLLQNVPNFDGVRIHPGNTSADTLGCILVGRNWTPGSEQVTASKLAFEPLKQKIVDAIGRGEPVQLVVTQDAAPPELAARSMPIQLPTAAPKKRQPASVKNGRTPSAKKRGTKAAKKRVTKSAKKRVTKAAKKRPLARGKKRSVRTAKAAPKKAAKSKALSLRRRSKPKS